MARPALDLGTHGKINVIDLTTTGPDGRSVPLFEARCRFRDRAGVTRQLRRTGKTAAAAERAVKRQVAKVAHELRSGELSPATRFGTVAEHWYRVDIAREAALGTLAHGTARLYRGTLDNHVLPAVGQLGAGNGELTGTALDALVKRTHDKIGYATAKTVRAVLRGICSHAVRHGVMPIDLSKSIGRLVQGDRKEITPLSLHQRLDLLAKLTALAKDKATDKRGRSLGARARVWADLPDVVRAMLCTGVRLGELLALDSGIFGRNQDGAPVVHVVAHIVREHGQLVRKRYRKGSKHRLTLQVPEWSVPMWARRTLAAGTDGPLFPAIGGSWLHPDNMGHRLREAFDAAGYAWLSSHDFRATVASVLDEAGLPSRPIADQLGHATERTTREHYIAPRAGNPMTAAVLEGMLGSVAGHDA